MPASTLPTLRSRSDLNPLPLVAIIANCTAWILYGCINEDPYVIIANEPGLLLGLFMTVSCYGFADPKAVHDSFIVVPNAIGATFGFVQIVLIKLYPAKKVSGPPADEVPLITLAGTHVA
ncbi:hypothetical protein TSOC_005152 [Tetrabaena socialis]|uniref:Uncharacterized protein n=1 Tax=Tetrabaena socialis TaxID=47790 RepID=A0A2J8A713_9CHLO|nr:hypothetical protein TSOC_005152 [Tetrabaena socialis]|eukprot:PNH08322.1 hypothetical protein TSOC_005152 [Tetrabaena socialis]